MGKDLNQKPYYSYRLPYPLPPDSPASVSGKGVSLIRISPDSQWFPATVTVFLQVCIDLVKATRSRLIGDGPGIIWNTSIYGDIGTNFGDNFVTTNGIGSNTSRSNQRSPWCSAIILGKSIVFATS